MSAERTQLSAVKLALMADEVRGQARPFLNADPIAIVGMSCRTPGGANSPEELWRLLKAGLDVTSEVPADRWDAADWFNPDPSVPGKSVTRRGGFLAHVDEFDAEYFGILDREAEFMDPQQRLALEVAIEAIDDAGVPHDFLKGSRTGVFVASYHNDYARLVYDNVDAIDLRTLTGTLQSIVANRISHFLDLRGPSITLDTACSASLVAVHLACQSLRMGETDFALAGGVSLMLAPELMVSMSKVGFMAPDGRCKTFDARADGFGRGEGCGMVVLKRLSDALAEGDRVIALIRGSAVNQDGRSTVLTAPNGVAQEALVREALDNASVTPERVVFVETHGTGTALGDPIEVGALAAALAAPDAPPCYLGAAKANIGHLEAAAGVVGLIKTAMVLRTGEVPPQSGFSVPNPHLQLSGTRLTIASGGHIDVEGKSPCAAVSSFGVGGTNAHVVLERAPVSPPPAPSPNDGVWTLPLSAKTPEALNALGRSWLALLDDPSAASVADLCVTASQRRTHYPVRLAVTGCTAQDLRTGLAAALELPPRSAAPRLRMGFVYSGQGPQWWAMGRQLSAREPVFRAALESCDAAIAVASGWSVLEELARDEQSTRLGQTEIAQPALFALQVSLTALWRSWGVTPYAVTGHSVGEIAAYHAAGALSLEEAARVVVLRGRIMQAAAGAGRMASVSIPEDEARALTQATEGRLDIAAVNGPRAVVLSGDAAALDAALAQLAGRGVQAHVLPVNYAFHSRQMVPLAERFKRDLGKLAWCTPNLAIYSTLTGAALPKSGFTSADVAQAIQAPVRFADAVEAMAQAEIEAFVEIGPHPVLRTAIAETLGARPPRVIASSLRRGRDESKSMCEAAAALYMAGVEINWNAVQPGEGAVVSLPAYPWQRRRHWLARKRKAAANNEPAGWLGRAMPVAGQNVTLFQLDFNVIGNWLADHQLFGRGVVPGAAIMQAMHRAARTALERDVTLREIEIVSPLTAPDDAINAFWQIAVSDDPEGTRVTLDAGERVEAGAPIVWRAIAQARVGARISVPKFSGGSGRAIDVSVAYDRFQSRGAHFGPSFRLLSDVLAGTDIAHGWAANDGSTGSEVSPEQIDAGIQLASLALADLDALYLPIAADMVDISPSPCGRVRASARLIAQSENILTADVVLEAESGAVVATLAGLRLLKTAAAFHGKSRDIAEILELQWEPAPTAFAATAMPSRWTLLEPTPPTNSEQFNQAAAERGVEVHVVETPGQVPDDSGIVVFATADLDAARLAAILSEVPEQHTPRIVVVVTSGAVAASDGEGADAAGAALWGLAGVAALERPDFDVRLVDLQPGEPASGESVFRALEATAETRSAWRGDVLLVPRMRRSPAAERESPRRLTLEGQGLDGVILRSYVPPAPGEGEVRIRVAAAGVNFRDTLLSLGMYPGAPVSLGAECAGTIEAIGAGVDAFSIGDRVFGLAQGCHATHAVARADCVAHAPDELSDAQLASLPVAYITADIGLCHFGKMAKGDRVLIHAATGGVGLAAVALAQRAGLEVHASAGTPEKRALLKELGVKHVYDSRSIKYADEILAATGGAGVRIALNSLSGKFVGATLRALATGGVFLELGKRDIWSAEQVTEARPDIRYHVYDAGQMVEADPSFFADFARNIVPGVASGALPPPKVEQWPLSRAVEAFRTMARARHVGKLVLVPTEDAMRLNGHATYLISGGFGGLGLLTASWLIGRGARRVILVGRSSPSVEARAAVAALEANGADVRVAVADVTDASAMRKLFEEAAAAGAPVRGIVHSAGETRNGSLRTASASDFAQARHGKVEGAKTLRKLVQSSDLDFFIIYSAAGVVLGAPGQAAYSSANAEIDALAHQWRSEGMRAVSVAWGAWSEAGMFAALSEHARDAWRERGVNAMTAEQAFPALERFMARNQAYGVIANVDWRRYFAQASSRFSRSMFETFAPQSQAGSAAAQTRPNAVAAIRLLPPARRRAALEDFVREQVRTVIGLNQNLPSNAPLKDAGLDSLMAVELRNVLARAGGVGLPATLALDFPSIAAIAEKLEKVWGLSTAAVAKSGRAGADAHASSEAAATAELEAELLAIASRRF